VPPTLGDRLIHILTAIEDIRSALEDHTLADFRADPLRRMAVERLFEIMSEASRYIPNEMKIQEKHIAWQKLADLGNLLRHAYHRIDPTILWDIVENDLEPLRRFVERIVQNEKSENRNGL
jgi:uncharacterized protein with HEPN domain